MMMGIRVVNKSLLLKNGKEITFKYTIERRKQTQWMSWTSWNRNCIGDEGVKIEPLSDRVEQGNNEKVDLV